MKKLKSWMSWSTGKDSAFALMKSLADPNIEVCGIFSTVTSSFDRVSMHSTRRVLLEQQAKSLGIPLHTVEIPEHCSNDIYEKEMQKLILKAQQEGVNSIIFGDLFLQDIRNYREDKLKNSGITPLFPIWNYPTVDLAKELIASGFKAFVTCVDSKKLDSSFAGKKYDLSFLERLPVGVDPCGEYGEFHTFVYDCPIFSFPIDCEVGEIVEREGFCFTDLLLPSKG